MLRAVVLSLALFLSAVSTPVPVAHGATCKGETPCKACKNCRYCGYCAKKGGTCSVCRKGR